jgi:hypothetical protein
VTATDPKETFVTIEELLSDRPERRARNAAVRFMRLSEILFLVVTPDLPQVMCRPTTLLPGVFARDAEKVLSQWLRGDTPPPSLSGPRYAGEVVDQERLARLGSGTGPHERG